MSISSGRNTLVQTLVDEDKRGRVMSLFLVSFIGMAPFGNLLAGVLAGILAKDFQHDPFNWLDRLDPLQTTDLNLTGAAMTLRFSGTICLIAAGFFLWRLPGLRRHARPLYEQRGLLPVPGKNAS